MERTLRRLGAVASVILVASACGHATRSPGQNDPVEAGSGGSASSQAGTPSGGALPSAAAGAPVGGTNALPGSAGEAGTPSPTEGGAGGEPASGEAGGASLGGAGGDGGQVMVDPRPECELASLITLSPIRLVNEAGPGGSAYLEIDATNGTPDTTSVYNLTFSCTGQAVDNSGLIYKNYEVAAGETVTVDLGLSFIDDAVPGTSVTCTARARVFEKTPDDCANAQVRTIQVVVQ